MIIGNGNLNSNFGLNNRKNVDTINAKQPINNKSEYDKAVQKLDQRFKNGEMDREKFVKIANNLAKKNNFR